MSVYIPIGCEHPTPELFALPVDLLRILLEEDADDLVVCWESVGIALLHGQVYGRGCGRVEGEGVRPYKHKFSTVSECIAASYIDSMHNNQADYAKNNPWRQCNSYSGIPPPAYT